jgi:hypothetical protein
MLLRNVKCNIRLSEIYISMASRMAPADKGHYLDFNTLLDHYFPIIVRDFYARVSQFVDILLKVICG